MAILWDAISVGRQKRSTWLQCWEVSRYRVNSKLKSYKRFEEQIAADPENFKNLVIEFKYPELAGSKVTGTERVPTKFEATWVDVNGKSTRRGFENVPAGKGE